MTNEEIVLKRMEMRSLGKSPLKFGEPKRDSFWSNFEYNHSLKVFEDKIERLKLIGSVEGRVDKIITLTQSTPTYTEGGIFQCRPDSRRSTLDIWRIYKYYFGDIDVFTIMRALYQLVVNDDLLTYRCPDIRKRVFWYDEDDYEKDLYVEAELVVPLSEWEKIGLNTDNNDE